MKLLYVRCNGGDHFRLFRTAHGLVNGCPFDGWSMEGLPRVAAFVETLDPSRLSIDAIRELGVSRKLLDRLLVIEFATPRAVFDGISPGHHAIDGRIIGPEETPLRLL